MTSFRIYLNNLVAEKDGLDPLMVFQVEGPSGLNFIPLACLVERMNSTTAREQELIRDMLVRIDFVIGDVADYLRHLAGAIAI